MREIFTRKKKIQLIMLTVELYIMLTLLMAPGRTEPMAEYRAAWCLQDGVDSGLAHQALAKVSC